MMDFLSFLFQAFVNLLLFVLVPVFWWLIKDGKTNFFLWLGLKKPSFNTPSLSKLLWLAVGVSLVYAIISGYGTGYSQASMYGLLLQMGGNSMPMYGESFSLSLLIIVITSVLDPALAQEIFFRGFLLKRLSKRFGFKVGNAVQAVLFGLFLAQPFRGGVLASILRFALPAALGYFFGWLNEKKSDGSIVPSWVLYSVISIISQLFAMLVYTQLTSLY